MVESASVALGLRLTRALAVGPAGRRRPGPRRGSGCAARCGTRPRPTTGTCSRSPSPASWSRSDAATRRRPRAVDRGLDLLERLVPGDRAGTPTATAAPSTTTTAGRCTSTRCCTPISPRTASCSARYGAAAARTPRRLRAALRRRRRADPPRPLPDLPLRAPAPPWRSGAAHRAHPARARRHPRRVLSGALRYFLDRGASAADGAAQPRLARPARRRPLQRYSGPASPYWASKGFLGAAAPGRTTRCGRRTEEPAPGRGPRPGARAARARTAASSPPRADGLVRLHNHGS